MDANKKIDLDNSLYLKECKIMANIIQNHPLKLSVVASSSVLWIYLGQFWHTLKEDGSKYRLKFMLDRKELTLTLNGFRRIFHLPQAIDNNHERFVATPKFSKKSSILSEYSWFYSGVTITIQLQDDKTYYAELLWEGLHYALKNPSTQIPYPRFTKIIIGHYMTAFPEISRRARDKYYNLEDDAMVKNIFNSRKHKDDVGMKIPNWMITDEMKLSDHYRMTLSALRSPNPKRNEGESSAPRKSTVIRLRIPQRRSTRLTPPTPIPKTIEADDIILQDTIQLSLAKQKSRDELEAQQNVQKVKEHLIAEEIKKLVEGAKNVEKVEVNSSTLRQDDTQTIPETRLEPMSDKETEDDYKLKQKEKGKHVEESRSTPSPTTTRSLRIHSTLISSDTEKLQELMETDPTPSSSTPSSSSPKFNITGLIMEREKSQADVAKMIADAIQQERENLRSEISSQINDAITNHIPSHVDSSVRNYMSALKYKFEKLHVATTPCRPSAVRLRDQDDPHDDAHPEVENSAKSEQGPSTSGNQEKLDNFDFWTDSYATDDDEIPYEKVSHELMDEMLHTVDEAKLRKVVDEMLRQQCTSRDEHQYHIDQMQNFLKNDIMWESKKEIIILYLKKGSSRPEKIVMSLHKFPAVIFPDDDIEERTSRWELGHEHKFITNIVARRANGSIVSITKSDYKNLNKNDIEDMYMLIVNHKVDDYAETGLLWSLLVFIRSTMTWERVHDFQLGVENYQQKVNLTAPTITFLGIEKFKVFSIVSKPMYGILYKNNKKEKRVMRHQEVHKFCDATLKSVLEGLKSFNNDVKHEYVSQSLSNEDPEYLQLFKEEIEERLEHRD
ncbi:hypothetical protein Tco_0365514 [Tanacetum coccineum]